MGGYNGPEDPNPRLCSDKSMSTSKHDDCKNMHHGDPPKAVPLRTYCCSTDALEIGEGGLE